MVNWHLRNAAKKNRKHPDIKDGGMVEYKLKPSMGTKSHEPKWTSTLHKIVGNPPNNQHFIPSVAVENIKTKLWLRHELLKAWLFLCLLMLSVLILLLLCIFIFMSEPRAKPIAVSLLLSLLSLLLLLLCLCPLDRRSGLQVGI